jgi:O-antigen/teichoic acid export membrane protein
MRTKIPKGYSHVLANLVGSAWAAIIGIAFVPIYVSRLGIESYGLIGFIATLQVWFSLLDMGFTTTLNREMAQASKSPNSSSSLRNLLRTLELIVLAIAIVIAITLIVGSTTIAKHWLQVEYLSYAEVANVIAVGGILISLRWISGLYAGALQGLQDQIWLNGCRIAMSTLRALGSVFVLYFIDNTIFSFFIFQAFSIFFECGFYLWRVYKKIPTDTANSRAHFSVDSLKGIWKYSAAVALYSLLGVFLANSDKVILSRLVSLSDFGKYSIATTISGALIVAASAVYSAAFPRFSSHQNDKNAVLNEFALMSQILSFLIIPAGLVCIIFGDDLMRIFLHTLNLQANEGLLLSLMSFGTMLNALMYLPVALLLASGQVRKLVAMNIVTILVFLPSILFLVPKFGIFAAALIWLALNFAYISLGALYIFKEYQDFKLLHWYWVDITLPLIFSATPLMMMKFLIPGMHGLGYIGLSFVLGLMTCFWSLPLLKEQLFQYLGKK